MIKLGLARADLGTLYRERIAPAARRKRELASIPDRPERFPLFLASGLGFAFAGCWPAGRFSTWRRIWSPVALALLLATLSLALLGAGQGEGGQGSDASQAPLPRPRSAGDGGTELAEHHREGQSAYASGRFEEALAAFESAIELAPVQPIPRYDAAATLFQLEQYARALERYQEARARAEAGLRTKIDFALGNTAPGARRHRRGRRALRPLPGLDGPRPGAGRRPPRRGDQPRVRDRASEISDVLGGRERPGSAPDEVAEPAPGRPQARRRDEQGPDEAPEGIKDPRAVVAATRRQPPARPASDRRGRGRRQASRGAGGLARRPPRRRPRRDPRRRAEAASGRISVRARRRQPQGLVSRCGDHGSPRLFLHFLIRPVPPIRW